MDEDDEEMDDDWRAWFWPEGESRAETRRSRAEGRSTLLLCVMTSLVRACEAERESGRRRPS